MGVYLHDGGDGGRKKPRKSKPSKTDLLKKEIEQLKSRVADLESILDDLPKMTALYQAVQEIQEQYEKPAMTFSHYLRG